MVWGWLIALVFIQCVACGMAELCSSMPTRYVWDLFFIRIFKGSKGLSELDVIRSISGLQIKYDKVESEKCKSDFQFSGGLYYASAVLAPPGWGPLAAWLTGWSNWLGQVTGAPVSHYQNSRFPYG